MIEKFKPRLYATPRKPGVKDDGDPDIFGDDDFEEKPSPGTKDDGDPNLFGDPDFDIKDDGEDISPFHHWNQ